MSLFEVTVTFNHPILIIMFVPRSLKRYRLHNNEPNLFLFSHNTVTTNFLLQKAMLQLQIKQFKLCGAHFDALTWMRSHLSLTTK